MNRPSQRGVALVITLLMLSVVTFMSVVFLAVSRREKASVTASSDSTDARLMADAAFARAQGEVVSRILATTNAGAYDFLVSTNYVSPRGFQPQTSGINVTNVGYWAQGSDPNNLDKRTWVLNKANQIQAIANLMYDARPPVYVRTNFARARSDEKYANDWDFRFYLDLNRNGYFEDTRLITNRVGGTVDSVSFATGDPQWIGILERPDRPHSETNRFIGRYAFLALPAGKSLDVNFIHNHAKRLNSAMTVDGFSRNQGVGSWELNLAGFLRELNTNVWSAGSYGFNADARTRSLGRAFDDANLILKSRYAGSYNTLSSMVGYFGPGPANALTLDRVVNTYSDAPLATGPDDPDLNKVNLAWSGSDSTNVFFDAQEFYNSSVFPLSVVQGLSAASANRRSDYDRYTFYRMLGQLGVDSRPALSNRIFQADLELHSTNKFNLNYQPASAEAQRRGIAWNPELDWSPVADDVRNPGSANASRFFHQVADRLLRASLATNIAVNASGRPVATHFLLGELPVRNNISVTNIQIYHPTVNGAAYWNTNNEYSAGLHRVLQVAANLYDATTSRRIGTNDYPTVFRPLFGKAANGAIYITGFAEVTNTVPLLNRWRDLNFPPDRDQIRENDNVFGVPWVVGVKKGLPNFNEFSIETAIQVSRKLELRRLAPRTFLTNQMYVLGISNVFGVEAWNSYSQALRRPVEIVVTNRYTFALSNVVDRTTNLVMVRRGALGSSMTTGTNGWQGMDNPQSYLLPVHTNFLFVTNSAYLSRRPPFLYNPLLTNLFEPTLEPPRLYLYMTNRLQYWVIDRSVTPNRILDFVNLDGLNSTIDIPQALTGDQTAGGGGYFRDKTISEGMLWLTNRNGTAPNAPTMGIINQMAVSVGDPRVAGDIWRSHETSATPEHKQYEIESFRKFLAGTTSNAVQQAPFTPTRKIYQRLSWQANDPLVHYMTSDLSDPVLTNPNSTNNYAIIRPAFNPLPQSNLRLMNERYQPWGGNPQRQATGLAYSMAAKDPLVRSSDDWSFPTNKFPNIGWLGRVHRGTPWQTVYLKSHIDPTTGKAIDVREWGLWSGSYGTHPTNDWKFVDLFTVAPNANAARGLLSVNQTNAAAWSAALSGVSVYSNSLPNLGALASTAKRYTDRFVEPATPQLQSIVAGLIRTRSERAGGLFESLGEVLATPELTVRSPFLNLSSSAQLQRGLTDDAVERIPQQILSLLKSDEPRIVVYAFGQSLKPAERSITTSGNFYNICTNYQITGEVVAKAVLRVEDAPRRPRVVVESYNILPAE